MYCGIDVAKGKSQVCILDSNLNRISEFEINNDIEGFRKLESHLTKDAKIGMEVTGVYSHALYHFLKEKYHVAYVNNFQMHNFALLQNASIKNDKIDAKTIAKYMSFGEMKTIDPIRMIELKDLSRLYYKNRTQLTKYKLMYLNQLQVIFPELEKLAYLVTNKKIPQILLKFPLPELIAKASIDELYFSYLNYPPRKSGMPEFLKKLKEVASNSVGIKGYPTTCFKYTIRVMIFYREIIDEITQKMEESLKATPYCSLLDKFGYNIISLSTMVGEIGDIRRFPNHKKFVKYCGFDATEHQSGIARKNAYISKRGNNILRGIFYLQALIHLNNKTDLAPFYNRLKAKGKHSKKCMVALARKVAIRTYYDMMHCHETQETKDS